jgi:hypothetical protein
MGNIGIIVKKVKVVGLRKENRRMRGAWNGSFDEIEVKAVLGDDHFGQSWFLYQHRGWPERPLDPFYPAVW